MSDKSLEGGHCRDPVGGHEVWLPQADMNAYAIDKTRETAVSLACNIMQSRPEMTKEAMLDLAQAIVNFIDGETASQ